MDDNWTRRQLLTRAGTAAAAGVAGLGLAGCGTGRATQRGGSSLPQDVQHFVSRPDLTPPKVHLTHLTPGHKVQYLFLAVAASGPGQGGAMIMNTRGELVWFAPDTADNSKMDFQCQYYQGRRVLTWFQGRVVRGGHGEGIGVIADTSYDPIRTIRAWNGLRVDLHEFVVTPQGTALVSAFRRLPYDLSARGGPKKGWLLSGVAQEIDIATGELLFQWDSLDHVPVPETYAKPGGPDFGTGTAAKPFDYFHINSIAEYDDEHLLIGARNTWCVYKIRRTDGQVVWRLNGKKSDFTMGPGSQFYWQHDARPHDNDTLTIFDDGDLPKEERVSRALLLDIDTDAMLVTLGQQFVHPGFPVLSKAMGNAQLLPDGGMFVGWGTNPYFSEFSADGKLVFDGAIAKGAPTYRSFIGDWDGHPTELPAAAARRKTGGATVYASWNGATAVASWTVLAGKSEMSLAAVAAAQRTGFETAITVPTSGPYFAVQARDSAGHVLSGSIPVRIS